MTFEDTHLVPVSLFEVAFEPVAVGDFAGSCVELPVFSVLLRGDDASLVVGSWVRLALVVEFNLDGSLGCGEDGSCVVVAFLLDVDFVAVTFLLEVDLLVTVAFLLKVDVVAVAFLIGVDWMAAVSFLGHS
jgi:hypothetical protein